MRRFRRMASIGVIGAMAVVLLFAGLPAGAAPATYFEADFEDRVDVFDPGQWGLFPLEQGHEGRGLLSRIDTGEHWGSGGHWEFERNGMAEPERVWWRYYLKFAEGFYIEPPNRGKLPGPAALYGEGCRGNVPSTAEVPCFSARTMFSRTYPRPGEPLYPDGPDDKTLLGYYVYHVDSPATRGDIWSWDPAVATLDHGPWYCIEGYLDLNTPGAFDGTLRGWVDGEQAFSRNDIRFRRTGEGGLDIKSFWFDVYYGGSGTSPRDNEIHFDSLAVGPERIGCDDAAVYTPPFRDDDGHVFEADIVWLAATGVTRGCNPPTNDRFCPDDVVTRGQMAAFLARAFDLPAPGGNPFRDDDGHIFESDIEALAAAGVTRGCNPPVNDRFCPDRAVTRGEMAAFLVRAYGWTVRGADFIDDDGSVFEADIERLAAAGVTRGCNPPANDRFCPDQPVTRGAMAAFLHRAEG